MSNKEAVSKVFVKGDQSVYLADTFIFDTSIYKCANTIYPVYSLFDSTTTKNKAYREERIQYHIDKEGLRWKQVITLEAAPLAWLQKNKFEEQK